MNEINDEVLAGIFRNYTEAPHTRQKTEVLVRGVKDIFFKLPRYAGDQNKYREKAHIAIEELENLLNRFYYPDKEFIEKLLYEAKAYILEHEEK
jgi:hypothetical protein